MPEITAAGSPVEDELLGVERGERNAWGLREEREKNTGNYVEEREN